MVVTNLLNAGDHIISMDDVYGGLFCLRALHLIAARISLTAVISQS